MSGQLSAHSSGWSTFEAIDPKRLLIPVIDRRGLSMTCRQPSSARSAERTVSLLNGPCKRASLRPIILVMIVMVIMIMIIIVITLMMRIKIVIII